MIMYKLCPDHPIFGASNTVIRLSDGASIPCVNDNTDYAQFKKDILDGAELVDADGNPMTAEQAKEYVKELP
jgi:hypothetical protein